MVRFTYKITGTLPITYHLSFRTYHFILSHSLSPTIMDSTTTSSPIMLTAYTVQQWKFTVENKAFDLNAYGILTGEEKKPGSNADDKVKSDYASRRSKLIGYVRSTLDHSQLETVLSGIQVTDIAAIWEKLLETYQPKTSGSRISVLQEMMALRMRSPGFEKET